MPRLTKDQCRSRDLQRLVELLDSVSEEDRATINCYLRQRESLIDGAADLASLAARAILYIASIWENRGSGEIYESVTFKSSSNALPVTFHYQKLLNSIKSNQDLLKIIDPDLEFGNYGDNRA